MQLCEIFAANLRREREKRGLTQAQLSEKAGVGEQTVFNYENYRHPLNFDIIESICKALGVAPEEMMRAGPVLQGKPDAEEKGFAKVRKKKGRHHNGQDEKNGAQ